ncbi:MAG: PDZ domain-containing protein, partial [Candidatus Rokuibacteriota bacterium]
MKVVLAAALTLVLLDAAAAAARPWAWLGVRIRDMSEQEMNDVSARHGIREGFGVVIVEVLADTPAARAGLQNGDIVVAVGGRPITETRLLQRLIASASTAGDTSLTVLRSEGRRQFSVRLATMPREVAGERVAAEFGFVLREAQPPAGAIGASPASGGLAVGAVLRGGAAEKAGLQVGDVLVQVEERPVLTRDAAREALAEASLDRPLRLTVRRGEGRLSLALPVP